METMAARGLRQVLFKLPAGWLGLSV